MSLVYRVRLLLTGRWVVENAFTGKTRTINLPWDERWALAGVHSYDRWWVRRWVEQPCGCRINPITRRRPLYGCDFHCDDDD